MRESINHSAQEQQGGTGKQTHADRTQKRPSDCRFDWVRECWRCARFLRSRRRSILSILSVLLGLLLLQLLNLTLTLLLKLGELLLFTFLRFLSSFGNSLGTTLLVRTFLQLSLLLRLSMGNLPLGSFNCLALLDLDTTLLLCALASFALLFHLLGSRLAQSGGWHASYQG
jgi:hypothetical protein